MKLIDENKKDIQKVKNWLDLEENNWTRKKVQIGFSELDYYEEKLNFLLSVGKLF